MRRAGVKINSVVLFNAVGRVAMLHVQNSLEQKKKLTSLMLMSARRLCRLRRQKFRKIGIELPVGDQVAKAFEKISRIIRSRLRHAYPIRLPMNSK